MTGCLLRGSEGVAKPRSGAGWYAGSHPALQRLVGPVIQHVQPAYERMGFVQGWQIDACLAAGRVRHACVLAASRRQGVASRVRKSIPLPPRPFRTACGAHSKIFPPFSLGAFPYFFNDNHVKDFYDKRQ
jgi:hypothetical protein